MIRATVTKTPPQAPHHRDCKDDRELGRAATRVLPWEDNARSTLSFETR
jgi:hypothetical protein